MSRHCPAGTPRLLIAVTLILPMALVIGVLVAAAVVRGQRPAPLLLHPAAAPAADSADCTHLLAALPQQLDGGAQGSLDRRELAASVPSGAAAWGEPPVVLRCGLDRPAELTATSRLLDVSGVQFLGIPHPTANAWVAVDRPRYVVVALPPGAGSGPLQQIAEVIAETLPTRQLDLPR
ncbi:MAG: DUF3515 domain-containing protein [Pseudonocardiales bacterium]